MARKKRSEEHENHERWLVSYADFITLLFAFFVVMYSVSSVNEGKYRVLSDSIIAAFRDPSRSLEPIQIGELMRSPMQSEAVYERNKPVIEIFKIPLPGQPGGQAAQNLRTPDPVEHAEPPNEGEVSAAANALADSIQEAMAELVKEGLIEVRRDARWIEVEIKSSILFPSGSAILSEQSEPVLHQLADKLRPLHNAIHVEGFTDDVPINNFDFYSNWELSAARAASVVHLFTRLGIEPRRMAAIGYGEYRPIASNATPEGRARNRRVVLVIMSGADERVSARFDQVQTRDEAETLPAQDAVAADAETQL